MNGLVRLFDPISASEPHEVVVDASEVWRSPAGHYCIGWSWLDEDCSHAMARMRCATTRRALFGFRSVEMAEVRT